MEKHKKFWRWQLGRQATGYHKMLICRVKWPFAFDIYILKFPEGCKIPKHTDKVKNGRHYRLNIVLKQAKSGGRFLCDKPIFETRWVKLFRPDIMPHAVTEIERGCRYVLSIGWVKKDER